ncbi:MAG: type II secretion system protein GspJ [Deltaproteobacteria bacterium]|nr:type II secretion system protein GspJ [Deltaproteobacteria bacterium]
MRTVVQRPPRGFTLIEVMMAMAIISIISVLIWASFGRLLTVTADIEERDAYWHNVRLATSRVAREVSLAFISDNYDKERYRADDPEGRPTFFVIEDGGDSDRLSFTAFANTRLYADEKVSDQAILEYFLDHDDEGVTGLYRRKKTLIDADWDRGGETHLLLEGVTAFDVEWWNPDDEDWEERWSTRDTDQHDRIPSRIRITLKVTDPDGVDQTFTTQARVQLTQPLTW